MNNTLNLKFEFSYRQQDGLGQVNRLLEGLALEDMEIEELVDSFLTTWEMDPQGNRQSVRYETNLARGELVCILAADGKGLRYRIDGDVIFDAAPEAHDHYADAWRKAHPDRVLRMIRTTRRGDDMLSCLLVHHQREENCS